jgi:hypothetical protein
LDQTLRGAVDALAESLSTAKPLFFGRVQRVRRMAKELAKKLQIPHAWRVDVAAVFSQLAYLALPENVTEDVYYRKDLNKEIKALLAKFPEDTRNILDKIPGLEEIGEVLKSVDVQYRFEEEKEDGVRIAASILKVALDFDYYEEQGYNRSLIVSTLKERKKDYDPKVTESLSDLIVIAAETSTLQEIKIEEIDIGMRLSQELRLDDGFLIAAAGTDVDRQLLKVIRNYNSCYADSPFPSKVQVIVPASLLK